VIREIDFGDLSFPVPSPSTGEGKGEGVNLISLYEKGL